jgi:hypothetical protein
MCWSYIATISGRLGIVSVAKFAAKRVVSDYIRTTCSPCLDTTRILQERSLTSEQDGLNLHAWGGRLEFQSFDAVKVGISSEFPCEMTFETSSRIELRKRTGFTSKGTKVVKICIQHGRNLIIVATIDWRWF